MYSLITTKDGPVPIGKIREGQLVRSHGEWIPSPLPEVRKCCIMEFYEFPTTAFEADFVNDDCFCAYADFGMPLRKHEKANIGLSMLGFLTGKERNFVNISIKRHDEVGYWYSRLASLYEIIPEVSIVMSPVTIKFLNMGSRRQNKLEEEDFSMRNLEYYVEGLFRRNCFWNGRNFGTTSRLNENDKVALRFLGINISVASRKESCEICNIADSYELLSHIKDSYNKEKLLRIPQGMMSRIVNRGSHSRPYEYFRIAKSVRYDDALVLPGINPDVNSLSIKNYN